MVCGQRTVAKRPQVYRRWAVRGYGYGDGGDGEDRGRTGGCSGDACGGAAKAARGAVYVGVRCGSVAVAVAMVPGDRGTAAWRANFGDYAATAL